MEEMSSLDVMARLGEPFEVRLEANPTTGYSWTVEYDKDMMELVSYEYKRSTMLIGGGGYAIFMFLPLRRGDSALTMRYMRPWEDEPIKVIRYSIEVV